MKIQVDGSPLLVPIAGNSLGQVLDVVFDFVEARRRGVVALQVDGTRVRYDELDEDFMARSVSTIQKLNVNSESVEQLALQSLDELDEVVQDLALYCHEISRVYHDVKSTDGAALVEDLRNAWNEIAKRHEDLTRVLGIAPRNLKLEVGNLFEHRLAVKHQLNTMLDALNKDDRVSVSDLFEYELAPLAEAEAELSAVLRERLVAQRP